MNWRFSIPFLVNQSASILFVMLVSRYPVSIVVPCVNALQFVFTAVVGYLIGSSFPTWFGPLVSDRKFRSRR
ncbi:unnamed protein product [Cylicostephanus goldi]|uniref:Uncharacterized protein n=1 Tax=Cylicostephanus goldi TaxID=71465 RepID=A0A3P7QQU8_CYLGO|nr:unnamed protein product [Cylicostephanus goldi]